MLNQCVTVCNANLRTDLMSSVSTLNLTNVVDRTCNQVMLLTDDPGLQDVTDANSGPYLTLGQRTIVIATLSEIAARYAPSSETYKAAQRFEANKTVRGLASFFILGFWDFANGESVSAALDDISNCTPCFCHVSPVHFAVDGTSFMDSVFADQIADWSQTNERMSYQDSIDADTENPANTTNLKARLNALALTDQSVNYLIPRCEPQLDASGAQTFFPAGTPVTDYLGGPVVDPATNQPAISDGSVPINVPAYPYEAFMIAGYVAGQDLSQRDSGYDVAYKPQGGQGWVGIAPSGLDDAQVFGATGSFPDGTLNPQNNGYANVYAQTAGYPVVFSGLTVTGNPINQSHLNKFLRRQLRDEQAALFVQRRKVPYTDARGASLLLNAIARVMNRAQGAGHFTPDPVEWERAGPYLRKGTGWVIRGESFADQSAARKGQRLAPAYTVCYIPSSSVVHVPIELCTLSSVAQLAA